MKFIDNLRSCRESNQWTHQKHLSTTRWWFFWVVECDRLFWTTSHFPKNINCLYCNNKWYFLRLKIVESNNELKIRVIFAVKRLWLLLLLVWIGCCRGVLVRTFIFFIFLMKTNKIVIKTHAIMVIFRVFGNLLAILT